MFKIRVYIKQDNATLDRALLTAVNAKSVSMLGPVAMPPLEVGTA